MTTDFGNSAYSGGVNQNATSLVWQNYLDVQLDVKPYLQIPSTDTSSDYQIQLITDAMCQWAQNKLGQPVAATEFDRRFNGWAGWNGAYIQLPYYPVLQIISVSEYWGVAGQHLLPEQTPTNQVDGFQCDYARGMLIRVFPGLVQKPWFPGSRNIEVVWTAGWSPIPTDIKLGTLELIAYWWRNTQQASRSGPARASEYDAAGTNPDLWVGIPHRVTSFLEPYMQVGLG